MIDTNVSSQQKKRLIKQDGKANASMLSDILDAVPKGTKKTGGKK